MPAVNGDVKNYGKWSGDAFDLVYPKGREFLGGDLLGQTLKALGVEVAFGIHGGHLDAFLYGASEAGIKLVDTRHEQAAVNAAEGYAKVSKKVGVCFATANSGYSNALPGLATAFADRSPIFCVTSSPPLRDSESNCLQGVHDQVVVAKPLTKFAYRVTHAEEIPRLVAYAFRVSISANPGPTLIDFPIDVLFTPVDSSRIAWGSVSKPMPFPPGPHTEAIKQAVAMLKAAKRPVLITGTGASDPKMKNELVQFIETLQIPTFHSLKSTSPLPSEHALQCGIAWNLPGLKEVPDLIFLLGARTGMFLGNRSGQVLPPSDCKFIQVDTDGAEIGKAQAIDLGIVSDSEQAIIALNAALRSGDKFSASKEWVKTATDIKTAPHHHENDPEVNEKDGRMHPLHAVRAVFKAAPKGSIVLTDGGDAMLWGSDCQHLCQPSLCMFTSGLMGMLGNAYGYALGCAIADPSRQVIQVQGDGSAGFHLAELDTFARFGCKILTIVVNNSIWGMSSGGQEILYGKTTDERPAARNLNPQTPFDKIGEALGCKSATASKISEIESIVKDLSGKPAVLNLIVSNKPTHPGTVAMVDYTDDPNFIVVPYYDNVPRISWGGTQEKKGQAESHAADFKQSGTGLGEQAAGTAEKAEGILTGDSSREAEGRAQDTKGSIRENVLGA